MVASVESWIVTRTKFCFLQDTRLKYKQKPYQCPYECDGWLINATLNNYLRVYCGFLRVSNFQTSDVIMLLKKVQVCDLANLHRYPYMTPTDIENIRRLYYAENTTHCMIKKTIRRHFNIMDKVSIKMFRRYTCTCKTF